ncbi:MAG: hypothetical protein RI544_00805 [Haloquadratum sp.]|jgi:hypothetical protein|nr:hypothetical protein [Haloferacaceae archaeon]MDR9444680.1 hypothetical protein [Haloquadratum sp.]
MTHRLAAVALAVLVVLAGVPLGGADVGERPAATSVAGEPMSLAPAVAADRHAQLDREGTGPILSLLGISPIDVDASTLRTAHVRLGEGLWFDRQASTARLATTVAIAEIDAAPDPTTKQQATLRAVSQIEQRVVALTASQQQAITAFGTGELGADAFLWELARIDAVARELQHRQAAIEARTDADPALALSAARLDTLAGELAVLTGPVRAEVRAVVTGEAPSNRFFAQVGPQSVVLSVISDGVYIREAYRGEFREGGPDSSISSSRAEEVVQEGYPTIWSMRTTPDPEQIDDGVSARIELEHERGRLVAYVDAESERVFRGVQYRPLELTSTRQSSSAVKDGLRLTAHPTFPGGPILFELVRTDDGAPLDAPITVGPPGGRSVVVGETAAVWTIEPAAAYQVTAIDGSSVVFLEMDPAFPPLIYGSIDEDRPSRRLG